jgi:hypothetical protein
VRVLTLLIVLLVVAAPLAGCLKKKGGPVDDSAQLRAESILGQTGHDRLVDAAAIIPKNFSFPEQNPLASVLLNVTGKVGTDATGSYEAERDEGGVDFRSVYAWTDVASLLPPGQPAELVVKLVWDASEANSADLDLAIDVPGTKTSYSSTSETLNWNLAVKTAVIDTVGVSGLPARIGVQISSGVVSKGFDYALQVQATYVKDVLTPFHPWALTVPNGASGLILESEKAGGDEHISSQFVLIDPQDDLVRSYDYNDINVSTQSVFIPVTKPGDYVFYAFTMHGGFLRVKADVPLDRPVARPLALAETRTVDAATPSPGVAGKDVLNGTAGGVVPDTDTGATSTDFAVGPTFPLRVAGYIAGPASAQAKITLSSPLGEVHRLTRIAHASTDQGTIGYTSEHEGSLDNVVHYENMQKGAWKASVVDTSPGVEIGHVILTYKRELIA